MNEDDIIYSVDMDKIYTITLDDGTVIPDLRLNGNNFISKNEITKSIFDGHLRKVIINDGEMDIVHNNMKLVQIIKEDQEWKFVLRDVSYSEIEASKMRSDIDFLAMMADLDF